MADVIAQSTPNPQAFKFTIDGHVFSTPVTINDRSAAEGTPFEGLLDLPGVVSIFATSNFVTLMKEPAADWEPIVGEAKQLLSPKF